MVWRRPPDPKHRLTHTHTQAAGADSHLLALTRHAAPSQAMPSTVHTTWDMKMDSPFPQSSQTTKHLECWSFLFAPSVLSLLLLRQTTFHNTNHLQVYNLVAFTTFTTLCKHHSITPKETLGSTAVTPHPSPGSGPGGHSPTFCCLFWTFHIDGFLLFTKVRQHFPPHLKTH